MNFEEAKIGQIVAIKDTKGFVGEEKNEILLGTVVEIRTDYIKGPTNTILRGITISYPFQYQQTVSPVTGYGHSKN